MMMMHGFRFTGRWHGYFQDPNQLILEDYLSIAAFFARDREELLSILKAACPVRIVTPRDRILRFLRGMNDLLIACLTPSLTGLGRMLPA
jgi:hypothetical protein